MSRRGSTPGKAAGRGAASRAPLTRERILRVAARLADRHGIDALSMRKLAQALGVEAMSLYNHVANKEDLLAGLVELVVGEIDVPAIGGDWKSAMRQRAISAHATLMRHPWATMLIVSRANVGPVMLRYVDATIGCLRAAGFSYEMADHVWNALDSHIYGFTLLELNFPLDPAEYADAARQFLPQLPPGAYPHLRAMSRLVIDGDHSGLHEFEFGLDLLLGAIEQLRARGAA